MIIANGFMFILGQIRRRKELRQYFQIECFLFHLNKYITEITTCTQKPLSMTVSILVLAFDLKKKCQFYIKSIFLLTACWVALSLWAYRRNSVRQNRKGRFSKRKQKRNQKFWEGLLIRFFCLLICWQTLLQNIRRILPFWFSHSGMAGCFAMNRRASANKQSPKRWQIPQN